MNFAWDDLRYFLTVARTGRLTLAARQMGTDHTTVSRRLGALERHLDAELFIRSPRGYALTPAGERLLAHAEGMESAAADIQNEIAGERFSVNGVVRIGAPDGFATAFLSPCMAALGHKHPQLELQIVAMPRIFSLTKREADIAIGLARPKKGRLFSRKLTDYSLHLYASGDYLQRCGPIGSEDAIADHPMVGYIPELIFAPELDYLKKLGDGISPRLSSTNLYVQMRAAEAGAGLCILPDFIATSARNLVRILPEKIGIVRTFWIIAHMDTQSSARIRTVIEDIVEQARMNRDLFLPDHTKISPS